MDLFYQEKLIAKTASLYYVKNLNQKQISSILRISQATVSRLLNKAIKNLKVKKQTMKVSQNVKALKKAQSLGFSSINKTDYDKIMRSR